MSIHKSISMGVALALSATQCLGAGVVMYGTGQAPQPRDVASILLQGRLPPAPIKTRSIRMILEDNRLDVPQVAQAMIEAEPAQLAPTAKPPLPSARQPAPPAKRPASSAKSDDDASSLALLVQFAFDSALIPGNAIGQLDAVAAGIKLAPDVKLVIEGHTDSVGSAEYNLRLSSLRAESVRTYLITRHGVDPSRLRVVGMGKLAPLIPQVPTAPENRRVQFRAEA